MKYEKITEEDIRKQGDGLIAHFFMLFIMLIIIYAFAKFNGAVDMDGLFIDRFFNGFLGLFAGVPLLGMTLLVAVTFIARLISYMGLK